MPDTTPFRRAHYVFIATRVRQCVPLGSERDRVVVQLLDMLSPIPGFKPSRFEQACYADDPARAPATKSRAASASRSRQLDRVDSGQS